MSSCSSKVEHAIGGRFYAVGRFVGSYPKRTILGCILLTVLTGGGFAVWESENRDEKLWVPQDTLAEQEGIDYESYFDTGSRFESLIVTTTANGENSSSNNKNVLSKETLVQAMELHLEIEKNQATIEGGRVYDLVDLCLIAGGACVSEYTGVCLCLVDSLLKLWNYDLETLLDDDDVLDTINKGYDSRKDLEAILGNPVFDEESSNSDNTVLLSAEAFSISYFLESRGIVKDGTEVDPVNEGWEEQVFLKAAESVNAAAAASYNPNSIRVDYVATRSFSDEFNGDIDSDILLVQVSYVVAFLFLGATLGTIRCGEGSRWTMAFAGIAMVGLSTAASFGLGSLSGNFFGPVHTILPFILLGIGLDDAFVIVNAFNRERTGIPRNSESNKDLAMRSARGLARAGTSITVTSATDMVAFGISSTSSLPALSSFCAYAAIGVGILWVFAALFFTATLVLDERRQRDNRRECLCCLSRKKAPTLAAGEEEEDSGFQEDWISRYFRYYHAPWILSRVGRVLVAAFFSGLLGFGIWGALNLTVEDTERAFLSEDSYLTDYFNAADKYYPSTGIDLQIVFEGGSNDTNDDIYRYRQNLSALETRLSGHSDQSPYIAEPISDKAYSNVMASLGLYLNTSGTEEIGNVTLGTDNWPTNNDDFVLTLRRYTAWDGPGSEYAQDVSFSEDESQIDAIKVRCEYVRLTKLKAGEVIDDSDRQIEAMDDTRAMIAAWEGLPSAFPYSTKFVFIESYKVIRRELFLNVGLAILAVSCIVFLTIGNLMASFLITLNVAMCIIEILGFMHALGIAIDSISVINMVLAVGLSVDYSAHVGHSFMVKGGNDKSARALEALADMGAAVLHGAISTFLAVVVLLFSSSYVFRVLSTQFALTVALGLLHGLILLPVMLSVFGPKPIDPISSSPTAVAGEGKDLALEDSTSSNAVNGGTTDVKKSSAQPDEKI